MRRSSLWGFLMAQLRYLLTHARIHLKLIKLCLYPEHQHQTAALIVSQALLTSYCRFILRNLMRNKFCRMSLLLHRTNGSTSSLSVCDSFIKMASMPFDRMNPNTSAAFCCRTARTDLLLILRRFCSRENARLECSLHEWHLWQKNIFHLSLSLWHMRACARTCARTRTFPF